MHRPNAGLPRKAELGRLSFDAYNPGSIDLQCPGESKWRDSNPRPFGPEPKIWSVFPVISASFRNLPSTPVFAGFFRLSPGISAYFQTIFKWTFGISQVQPSIATARVAA